MYPSNTTTAIHATGFREEFRGDIPAGLILDNHRVSLAFSATLIVRVCASFTLLSPTPNLATMQVVDANSVRSSRRPVPRSVWTARGVGTQPSLRRGASRLQGKHLSICLLSLQPRRFSRHAKTHSGMWVFTCGLCKVSARKTHLLCCS